MASGSTPTYLLPYPLPTDPVNVASDIEELADRLEIVFGTTASLTAANTFTNTNIFSVNSASTAVRITQVGSGNALLVEDEANPDTSAFVVTNAGDVGIGKLSPGEKLDVAGNIKLTGNLIFEGASEDAYELTIAYTDPTTDRTVTLPDVTGTVITTGNLTSITSVGTITSGTWLGGTITASYGGTGISSYGTGDLLYASAGTTLSALTIGTNGYVLTVSGGLPSWQPAPISLPSQTGQGGNYLTTDGSTASWAAIPVTSAATATTLGTVYGRTPATATGNISFGYNSQTTFGVGASNIGIGPSSLAAKTSGSDNIAIGDNAIGAALNPTQSIAIGSYALGVGSSSDASTPQDTVAIGYAAMILGAKIRYSVGIGTESLRSAGQSDYATHNTAVGYGTAYNLTTGDDNSILGATAGYTITTGNKNVMIGSGAGSSVATGSNNIIIGYQADATSSSVSNEITFGDSNITRLRVPGLGIDWTSGTVPTSGGGDPKPQIFMLMGA